MWNWIKDLDRILRGEATRLDELHDDTLRTRTLGLLVVLLVLGAVYGACMASFAVVNRPETTDRWWQLAACVTKVPALFFLTLIVTFPSLYVFNALVGSRLSARVMLRLLVASLGVNLAVLASLGPIVAFFSVSTTVHGYGFMVLLNVLVFAVSGGLGLAFLLQTLHRLSIAQRTADVPLSEPEPQPESDAPIGAELVEEPGALDAIEGHMLGRHVKTVFGCWMVVFGLVGAQMGWVLRPVIGDPQKPFAWFRPRESNFFEAVFQTLTDLL